MKKISAFSCLLLSLLFVLQSCQKTDTPVTKATDTVDLIEIDVDDFDPTLYLGLIEYKAGNVAGTRGPSDLPCGDDDEVVVRGESKYCCCTRADQYPIIPVLHRAEGKKEWVFEFVETKLKLTWKVDGVPAPWTFSMNINPGPRDGCKYYVFPHYYGPSLDGCPHVVEMITYIEYNYLGNIYRCGQASTIYNYPGDPTIC